MDNAGDVLTPGQAKRAIYIDFEGRGGHPPALLGVLYAEGKLASDDRLVLRQDILDRGLQPLAGAAPIADVYKYESEPLTIRQAIRAIAGRAKSQRRHIVSWSRYDASAVSGYGSTAYNRRVLSVWFRDGKATASRWKSLCRPDLVFTRDRRRGTHQLSVYLDSIGYAVPDDYGKGTVGQRLRVVQGALERRGDWVSLTENQRQKWLSVLNHNRHDLEGMRVMVIRAATELAVR